LLNNDNRFKIESLTKQILVLENTWSLGHQTNKQSYPEIQSSDLGGLRDLIFLEKQKRDAQMEEMNKQTQ
jgi:hypothetical protein